MKYRSFSDILDLLRAKAPAFDKTIKGAIPIFNNCKNFFSRVPGRITAIALVTVTAALFMANGWRTQPEDPQPVEPPITALARTVAIGGSDVSHAQISNLSTRSTVATVTSDPQVTMDQYRFSQLNSFAVQGWQGRPYLVTYTSSDESVCTVSDTGLVTGWAPGTATITATATDPEGHVATGTCLVQVNEALPPVDSISLNRSSVKLRMGGTGTNLSVQTQPAEIEGFLPPVVFSSSDESICVVDETGHVTAVAPGEAVVTATVGPLTATCNVTVRDSQIQEVSGIQMLNFDHSMIAGIGNQTPSRCSWFALRYARTILDGTPSSGSGMWSNGAVWSAAGYSDYNSDLGSCLNKLYSELTAGRPVIIHVKNAPGENICSTYEYWESGSGWNKVRYPHRATSAQYGHWMLVVGVSSDADPANLRESDFFALDPARVTDGSRICLTRLMDGTLWTGNSPLKVTG